MRWAVRLGLGMAIGALVAGGLACDRAVEPYSDEPVVAPDLSKIFPPGAERAPEDGPMGGAAARGAPPPAPSAGGGGGAAAGTTGAPLSGQIVLAPGLEDRIAPRAVVFVIARMGESGPPVAVKKIEKPTFPLAFEIGPDDRMLQGMPFTGPFRLSARLDTDGNATTRTEGDLQAVHPASVPPGTTDLRLLLDHPL